MNTSLSWIKAYVPELDVTWTPQNAVWDVDFLNFATSPMKGDYNEYIIIMDKGICS